MSLSPSIKHFDAYNKRMLARSAVFLFLFLLVFPLAAHAAPDFSASPMIIDGKGKPREILSYSITLVNDSSRVLTFYPWVTNYSASGTEPMPDLTRADLSSSLANWIELTRGVIRLEPGASQTVPVLIQISNTATPGNRHALIKFAHGTNRIEAESNVAGTLVIPVNIEVVSDAKEILRLASFAPARQWFTSEEAAFSYELENTGNRGLVPRGKVRIFDRRGAEVAAIDANRDGERLDPSEKALLSAVWAADGGFGRYKAMLDLSYGDASRGTLQDTIFFWVIPWQKLLGLFASITIAAVIIAVLLHSRLRASPSYAPFSSRMNEDENASERLFGLARLRAMIRRRNDDPPALSGETGSFVGEEHPPRRTTLDSVDSVPAPSARPRPAPEATGAVRIEARKRKEPDPRHVVNLRRP